MLGEQVAQLTSVYIYICQQLPGYQHPMNMFDYNTIPNHKFLSRDENEYNRQMIHNQMRYYLLNMTPIGPIKHNQIHQPKDKQQFDPKKLEAIENSEFYIVCAMFINHPEEKHRYRVCRPNPRINKCKLPGGQPENGEVLTDTMCINSLYSRFKSMGQANSYFQKLRSDKTFYNQHQWWQVKLYNILLSSLPHDRSFINREYCLFIHLVTHPHSPQTWRRIKVHGSVTLHELSEILIDVMGWQRTHDGEFRLQLKTLSNLYPNSFNSYQVQQWLYSNDVHDPMFEDYVSIRDHFGGSFDENCWEWYVNITFLCTCLFLFNV